MQDWTGLALRVALSGWMVGIAVWDHVRGRVPNWLVFPVMLGALAYQVYLFIVDRPASALGFSLITWAALFVMWQAHVIGGGDAKFLMALLALFPERRFLVFFALAKLAVTVPLWIYQAWKTRTGQKREGATLSGMGKQLIRAPLLPTEQDLQTKGRRNCWTYALPGVIFLWWIW